MFGFRPLVRQSSPQHQWTCLRCTFERPRIPNARPKPQSQSPRRRAFASDSTKPTPSLAKPPKKRRTGLIVLAATAVLGYGALNYTESGRYVRGALARSSRVASTLAANIRDYRETMKLYDTHSPEEWNDLLKACHQRCANRTLRTMEKNGSIFIKLGQHLTSLNYMLPSEWCDTFIPLQDKCPVTPFEDVKAMVEHDIGRPFTELFTSFSEQPLGAASLAQVHLATDAETGLQVAVKVQHPALDDWAPLDLKLTKYTFETIKRFFPDYDLTWLSDEMQVSLPQELDFKLEGDNAMHAQKYFAPMTDCPLIIPSVLWSKRRILVMQYMTGHRLDDLEYLAANNIDRDEVSAALARIFNTMIFAPGAPLHCDPHGGNIAIRARPPKAGSDLPAAGVKGAKQLKNDHQTPHQYNFDIILYDHGLYREIPLHLQRSYAKLWLSVLSADESGMRKAAYDVAGITDEQFPLFASAITGRDYRVVTKDVSRIPRSEQEREAISEALGEGMLLQLVHLLGQVPRIILLILKTNDLTRSLDTKLQTKRGPVRTFLILAKYAARTVLEEQLESLRKIGNGFIWWPLSNLRRAVGAYASYGVVVGKLTVYEWYLILRHAVGLENESMAGGGGDLAQALKKGG